MSLLFETIQIRRKKPLNLDLHNKRFNRSRSDLFGIRKPQDLKDVIRLPDYLTDAVYKCRVLYAEEVQEVTFGEYHPQNITSLRIADGTGIDYAYKWADRTLIDQLRGSENAEDIIIVQDGCLTDSSYANLILFDGKRWVTPSTPLLKGTMREYLLMNKMISEERLTVKDLDRMHAVKLVNAMRDFGSAPEIPINRVKR